MPPKTTPTNVNKSSKPVGPTAQKRETGLMDLNVRGVSWNGWPFPAVGRGLSVIMGRSCVVAEWWQRQVEYLPGHDEEVLG